MSLEAECGRRRTFAIISHPDAGKTTMTEKLLLYGGAVHMAGAVKGRKANRHAVSDWMEMEQERGISITSSVLQFEYRGCRLNLLDTPGHADFSEDTYRTLAAVDAAIMLIDAAKGVEARTKRLFEVCRLRKIPVLTFVNKMDRPGLEPLDLMDEVGVTLGVKTCALQWPIGSGPEFVGIVDRRRDNICTLFDHENRGMGIVPSVEVSVSDPSMVERLGEERAEELAMEIELIEEAGDKWDHEAFLAGELTPFFFGSAMTNFGVGAFLDAIVDLSPSPLPRPAVQGFRKPTDPDFAGFIFKIQANMNPRHRDRIAFMRVVSGVFDRGMEVVLSRTGKKMRLSKPHSFMASERAIVEDAAPGDIVGLYDPGQLRIGDTLFVGDEVQFQDIPRFAPEFFMRVRLKDPTRRKQLKSGLLQLSQEGTIQLFIRPELGAADPFLGAVGMLQFEVLKERLKNEYKVKVMLEPAPFRVARWVTGDPAGLAWMAERGDYMVVEDRDGSPVVLAETSWMLEYATEQVPNMVLHDVSPL